ncbi:DegT/DnrJ/EryC1/StrS family aminotransferase [Arthrobacter sp. E44]|uniref:DegT/DnrJ/EryC1/StrS family aminotransferase n=1 Tax=Arthrobacter sp. E44 TaxID=3341794 RepID=UPI0035A608E3
MQSEDIEAMMAVLQSDRHLSDGTNVTAFEQAFADYVGSPHAVAVSSCTMALELAVRSLELRPEDEVITTPLTFQATAAPLLDTPAVVKFADISESTLCLDPRSVVDNITERTRAVITTHYGGLCGGLEELSRITRERGIFLIEDCAHALGAKVAGHSAGTWGDIGCWSFHSLKNISTLGQGGMLTFRNPSLDSRFRAARSINPDARFSLREEPYSFDHFGRATLPRPETHEKNAYTHDCEEVIRGGLNAQMSDPAAAVGRSQLKRLDSLVEKRRRLANRLDEKLTNIEGVRTVQHKSDGDVHAHHLYAFLLDDITIDRDQLARDLEMLGVQIVLRYFPLHLLPEWRLHGGRIGLTPIAEDIWFRRLMNLPLSPQLTFEDVDFMAQALEDALMLQRSEPLLSRGSCQPRVESDAR